MGRGLRQQHQRWALDGFYPPWLVGTCSMARPVVLVPFSFSWEDHLYISTGHVG